jgi:RimJ/RimL family protein N-acetyltransferase
MTIKIYENDQIYVRPILESDVEKENYLEWFYNQEICKYNSHGIFSHGFDPFDITEFDPNHNIIWAVISKFKLNSLGDSICEDIHIGNAVLNINWVNQNAEFTCIFGEKEYWGKGYCTQVLKWIIDHGFNKLGLHKIWLGTINPGMDKSAKKSGMKIECIIPNEIYNNGEFLNINRWSIFDEELNV